MKSKVAVGAKVEVVVVIVVTTVTLVIYGLQYLLMIVHTCHRGALDAVTTVMTWVCKIRLLVRPRRQWRPADGNSPQCSGNDDNDDNDHDYN